MPLIKPDERARMERARAVLAESVEGEALGLMGLAKTIGKLEWWLGEMLTLLETINARESK